MGLELGGETMPCRPTWARVYMMASSAAAQTAARPGSMRRWRTSSLT